MCYSIFFLLFLVKALNFLFSFYNHGDLMVYCSNCAESLPEEAYFCLKCGKRTQRGIEAGISPPWNWEKQIEQTLSNVAREVEKAVASIRGGINQSTQKASVLCSHCGGKNLGSARFCYKCGSELG
jgi:predicted amidophosphoribosyltransferase